MKLIFSTLFIFSALFLYFSSLTAEDQTELPDFIEQTYEQPSSTAINVELNSHTHGRGDDSPARQIDSYERAVENQYLHSDVEYSESESDLQIEADSVLDKDTIAQHTELVSTETELPGKEVNFHLNLSTSTHHMIDGRATSDIGKILFKCRLMPSNEVKISMKFKQSEIDDVELLAYVDLVHFTLELGGSNSVLNKNHKQLMKFMSSHLESKFENQYKDYDAPEHALMLMRMIAYWSVSPKGYVHEKRSIVSQ